jgi:hypothetical protein
MRFLLFTITTCTMQRLEIVASQSRSSLYSFPSTTSAQRGHSSSEKDIEICSSRGGRCEERSREGTREHRLHLISSSTLLTETETTTRPLANPSLLTPSQPFFCFHFFFFFYISGHWAASPLASLLSERSDERMGGFWAEKNSQTLSRS